MISEHFTLEEFIDPVTFAEKGENALTMIDHRIVNIAELLRNSIGHPVIINNWHTGGQYKESGLRRLDSPTGAKKSAHKEGKAIDCKVVGLSAAEVHAFVLRHESVFYDAGVRQMEDLAFTPTWTHLSVRGTDNAQKKIQIIKP